MKISLLLCALPLEEAAWIDALAAKGVELVRDFDRGRSILRGSFEVGGTSHQLMVAVTGDGNARAGATTAMLIERYQPQVVVFSGIAGGLKDVSRGDVVIVSECMYFAVGKVGSTVTFDGSPVITSKSLLQCGKNVANNSTADFEIHVGKLAVTDVVLQNLESDVAKTLATSYRKAMAVAMEDYGVLYAASNADVPAISVRGISDLCADKDPGDDQKTPAAHACEVAVDTWFEWASSPPVVNPSNSDPTLPEAQQASDVPDLAGLTVPLEVARAFLGEDAESVIKKWQNESLAGFQGSAHLYFRTSTLRAPTKTSLSNLWSAVEGALLQSEDPMSIARITDFAQVLRSVTLTSAQRSSALRVAGNRLDEFSSCKHGRTFLEHALEDARADQDGSQLFASLVAMAERNQHDDKNGDALTFAREALELDRKLGVGSAVMASKFDLYVLMASLEESFGRIDAALGYLDTGEALLQMEALENAHRLWQPHVVIAQKQDDLSRLQQLDKRIQKEIDGRSEPGEERSRYALVLARVTCLNALRRFAEAEQLLADTPWPEGERFQEIQRGVNATRAFAALQSDDPADFERAVRLYQQLLQRDEKHFGPSHTTLVPTLDNLGKALVLTGRATEALVQFDRALSLCHSSSSTDKALHLQNRSWARSISGDQMGARNDSAEAYRLILEPNVEPSVVSVQVALQFAYYSWWVEKATAAEPLATARSHLESLPDGPQRDFAEREVEELEESLLEVEVDTAFTSAGIRLFPLEGTGFARVNGVLIPVVRERELIVTPELVKLRSPNNSASKIAMLIGNEIRTAARSGLETKGWSWFDRSTGEGRIVAAGTLIAISATPRPQRGPRTTNTSVNGKLRVGVWLLENPKHTESIREIARRVGLSVSQVSVIMNHWRNEALLEASNQPLLPEFFQEISKLWISDWLPCHAVPNTMATALTGTLAAEQLGAPTLGGNNSPKYLYVASETDLRKALAKRPQTPTQESSIFVALAPTPLIFADQILSGRDRLSPKSVIALDLSRGSARDRDVLAAWESGGNRVW